MKKQSLKTILCCLAALLVFCAGFCLVQRLVMPKYQERTPEGSLTAEYYREKLDHDVLLIGDCEVFSNVSPVTLYNEYGIASYIRGSAQQLVWHSYYLLEDALRTEKPKVVIYNVLALKYGEPQSEAYNRMTIDGMRWGKAKAGAIKASILPEEDVVSYVFPLFRFHSRWSELTEEDWKYFFREGTVSHNGYLMRTDVRPATKTPTPAPLLDPHLPASSMEWLERIYELCEKNDVRLILLKSPSIEPYWYEEWDSDVRTFADAHGILYWNTLQVNDEIGIDYSTDTCDMGQHLNVYGAEKLSLWLGKKLQETNEIPDRRTDETYVSVWAEKTERYEREKASSDAERES